MADPHSMLSAFNLRCEHLETVRGLNTRVPRFTWALDGEGEDTRQTAYRLVIGHDPDAVARGEGDCWDSGKIASGNSLDVAYAGPPLIGDDRLHWAVAVWDEQDRTCGFSQAGTIFTGLQPAEWRAEWIARYFVLPAGREAPADTIYDNRWQSRPADYLRRPFRLAEKPVRALLYVTALGLYEAYLNGQRIGDDVMAPGWTDYHKRVEYQVHDVTAAIISGENVLGAILGEGWYCGRVGHNQRRAGNHYGGRPALCCELHLVHEDGSVEVIASDGEWQTRQGPICYSDFLMGECYDARLELGDWCMPSQATGSWQPVEVFRPDPRPPLIEAARIQPVREKHRLPARFLHRAPTGEAIFDLGQNIAGYCELSVSATRGARFTLRHAEILDASGGLYTDNLRHAIATDIYITGGDGRETFKPRFTFHGFRYIGVMVPDGMSADDIALFGIAIHTDAPETGTIETGHPMVNQLLSNILWSQRDNFLSVPTDCPQRDERYGWTADAQVFWRTAGFNMDVAAFLNKWMLDIEDGQSEDGAFPDVAPTKPLNPYRLTPQPGAPGWGDAPIVMLWQHHLRYGDTAILHRFYPALERWMAHIENANPDGLRRNAVYNNYGDWLSVGPPSDRSVVATLYWIHVADLMNRIARTLGRDQDVARYRQLSARLRLAFDTAFVDEQGCITSDTQTVYLMALDFDALPEGKRTAAVRRLVDKIEAADGCLQTGFLGVRHLCPVLADCGAEDLALRLLLNDRYPSWGFSIRHGATTIWERWDGWTPDAGFQSASMNSFNHYAYGAVGEWIWSRIAGIDWDEQAPGFRAARLRPIFSRDIGWCKAEYHATTGTYRSAWSIVDDIAVWDFEIPPGCRGTVELPSGSTRAETGLDGGNRDTLTFGPGRHRLRICLPK